MISYREVLEEVFGKMVLTCLVVEDILNESLGLPKNFLQDLNPDRSWDFMVALRYYPATKEQENGLMEHEDGNIFTFLFQDEVGGLEVIKTGKWIPVTPSPRAIVVNISDTLQVSAFTVVAYKILTSQWSSKLNML